LNEFGSAAETGSVSLTAESAEPLMADQV